MKIFIKNQNYLISKYIGIIYFMFWVSVVLNYSSNRPLMDDYGSILEFMNSFLQSNFFEKIGLFFKIHNEHYLISSEIITLINFYVFKKINFLYLTIVANSFVIVLLIKYLRELKKSNLQILSLPFILIFLNLCSGGIIIWPMAALQHFSSLFLVFLTLEMFVNEKEESGFKLFANFITLNITVFSGGANILVLPLIIIYYMLTKQLKKLPKLIINILIIISIMYLYNNERLNYNYYDFIGYLKFIILFLGNPFKSEFGFFYGIVTILLIILGIKLKFYIKYPKYFYFSIFIFGVATLASIARMSYGYKYALEEKYTLYTLCCWASLILMYAKEYNLKYLNKFKIIDGIVVISYILSISICLISFANNLKPMVDLSNSNWIIYPNKTEAVNILKISEILGIYDGSKYVDQK